MSLKRTQIDTTWIHSEGDVDAYIGRNTDGWASLSKQQRVALELCAQRLRVQAVEMSACGRFCRSEDAKNAAWVIGKGLGDAE